MKKRSNGKNDKLNEKYNVIKKHRKIRILSDLLIILATLLIAAIILAPILTVFRFHTYSSIMFVNGRSMLPNLKNWQITFSEDKDLLERYSFVSRPTDRKRQPKEAPIPTDLPQHA